MNINVRKPDDADDPGAFLYEHGQGVVDEYPMHGIGQCCIFVNGFAYGMHDIFHEDALRARANVVKVFTLKIIIIHYRLDKLVVQIGLFQDVHFRDKSILRLECL